MSPHPQTPYRDPAHPTLQHTLLWSWLRSMPICPSSSSSADPSTPCPILVSAAKDIQEIRLVAAKVESMHLILLEVQRGILAAPESYKEKTPSFHRSAAQVIDSATHWATEYFHFLQTGEKGNWMKSGLHNHLYCVYVGNTECAECRVYGERWREGFGNRGFNGGVNGGVNGVGEEDHEEDRGVNGEGAGGNPGENVNSYRGGTSGVNCDGKIKDNGKSIGEVNMDGNVGGSIQSNSISNKSTVPESNTEENSVVDIGTNVRDKVESSIRASIEGNIESNTKVIAEMKGVEEHSVEEEDEVDMVIMH